MKKIKLTQGKFALVDDADFEWLNQWKWHAMEGHTTYYVIRKTSHRPQRTILMHREILGLKKGDSLQGDHPNGNGLDNRRANLRIATHTENNRNKRKQKTKCTSEFKGVSLCKKRNKWESQIMCNYKRIRFGHFTTPTEAAHTYDKAAIKYFGEFARLNFPVREEARDSKCHN